jgi:uncharacterized protein (TIGR02757 family)
LDRFRQVRECLHLKASASLAGTHASRKGTVFVGKDLKRRLERLYGTYHRPRYLGLDPLICLEPFTEPADVEIAGLVASSLAYGRVERIIVAVNDLLERMEGRPAAFVTATSLHDKLAAFAGFRHRFNQGRDVALLLEAARLAVDRWGSLGELLAAGLAETDGTMCGGLTVYSNRLVSLGREIAGERVRSFEYLVPSPANGSACKRINMYFRWMVRPGDGIDRGVWSTVCPSKLIVPVDTHVARVAHAWRLTRRSTPDWKMAEEITACLRNADPHDPVRFDFALCRYGMVGARRK